MARRMDGGPRSTFLTSRKRTYAAGFADKNEIKRRRLLKKAIAKFDVLQKVAPEWAPNFMGRMREHTSGAVPGTVFESREVIQERRFQIFLSEEGEFIRLANVLLKEEQKESLTTEELRQLFFSLREA